MRFAALAMTGDPRLHYLLILARLTRRRRGGQRVGDHGFEVAQRQPGHSAAQAFAAFGQVGHGGARSIPIPATRRA